MPSDDIFSQIAEDPAAMKKVADLEAEAAQDTTTPIAPEKPADTKPVADRAATLEKKPDGAPDSKTDAGTLPEAEQKEVETAKAEAEQEGKELDVDDKGVAKRDAAGKFIKRDKVVAAPAVQLTPDERKKFDAYLAEKQGSKYAKDFNRRLVTWSELNSEKDKFAAERATYQGQLKAAVEKFNADVATFQAEKAATTPTPEKYEAYAAKQTALANEKELAATKAEEAGDFDGAEKLRDEAKFARRDAEAATKSAEHVRKNPPLNEQQVQQKFQADQKTWVDKAAIDFPEFAKKDSPVFKATVEYFKQITASDPVVAKLPGFIYFAAERAAYKLSADKVPSLEKELGELRTKVKDLEVLTNPAGGGVVHRSPNAKKFDDLDADEQIAALKAEARGVRFD